MTINYIFLLFSVKVARSEWRKLRDNHREALRRAKLGQNRLLPPQITTWKYAKAMQFLEPYSKYRITENIESDSEPSVEPIIKSSHSDSSAADVTENGYTENLEGKNKRRCTEYSRDYTSFRSDQDSDALESFFNCILKSTREMPAWMQTQVKKKIFSVIIEAEESLISQDHDEDKSYFTDTIDITKIKTENINV